MNVTRLISELCLEREQIDQEIRRIASAAPQTGGRAPTALRAVPRPRRKQHKPSVSRYRLDCDCTCTLVADGRVLEGTILEMSSRAIAFRPTEPIRSGESVRVLVNWPFVSDPGCRMQLVVEGRVGHSSARRTRASILSYEYLLSKRLS